MAKVTAVTRYYKNDDGKKPIYIRISHKGKNKYINTNYYVHEKHWKDGQVSKSVKDWAKINSHIRSKISLFEVRIAELEDSRTKYTISDILKAEEKTDSVNFIKFARRYNKKFEAKGVYNSFRRHETIINKLEDYKGSDITFEDITVPFLTDYENYLASIGNSVNTIHGNLKVIRAMVYQAIREGIMKQEKNPFFVYKLKKKKVMKEKLTEEELKAFKEVKIKEGINRWDVKNYFLASYYLFGIRFSDLCGLEGRNIINDRVDYTMNKTSRKMSIEMNDDFKDLLLLYHESLASIKEDDYLFPILKNKHKNRKTFEREVATWNTIVNTELKNIAKKAKIKKNLTFHIARHTFADIARKKRTDIYDISKMLGHSSIKQTETYLASLDTESLDEAAKQAYK